MGRNRETFRLSPGLGIGFLADLDVEALDLLIERGERNVQTFGGFGLAPAEVFQTLENGTALEIVHDLEQRRVGRERAAIAARNADAIRLQQGFGQDIERN